VQRGGERRFSSVGRDRLGYEWGLCDLGGEGRCGLGCRLVWPAMMMACDCGWFGLGFWWAWALWDVFDVGGGVVWLGSLVGGGNVLPEWRERQLGLIFGVG